MENEKKGWKKRKENEIEKRSGELEYWGRVLDGKKKVGGWKLARDAEIWKKKNILGEK